MTYEPFILIYMLIVIGNNGAVETTEDRIPATSQEECLTMAEDLKTSMTMQVRGYIGAPGYRVEVGTACIRSR